MKNKKIIIGVFLVFLLIAAGGSYIRQTSVQKSESTLYENPIRGCTDILVGKKASVDGSVITVHTADCGMCDWTWRHIPAQDFKPDSKRKIYHIDQIRTWPPEKGASGKTM
ncbi:C69 family dipeptidase [Acidobacteriota bacterium]